MIKAVRSNADGTRKLLLLGLSEANVQRLRQDKPILIEGAELGLQVDVLLCHGANERAITEKLESKGMIPKGATAKVEAIPQGTDAIFRGEDFR